MILNKHHINLKLFITYQRLSGTSEEHSATFTDMWHDKIAPNSEIGKEPRCLNSHPKWCMQEWISSSGIEQFPRHSEGKNLWEPKIELSFCCIFQPGNSCCAPYSLVEIYRLQQPLWTLSARQKQLKCFLL